MKQTTEVGVKRVFLPDSFPTYKKLSDKPKNKEIYLEIVKGFMKFIVSTVLSGESVKLPQRMGELGVVGRKKKIKLDENGNPKGLAPNWHETKRLWERSPEARERKEKIYFLNEHTNNVKYKFIWSKKDIIVENKALYSFRLTKGNKRETSARIFSGQDYTILLPKEQSNAKH